MLTSEHIQQLKLIQAQIDAMIKALSVDVLVENVGSFHEIMGQFPEGTIQGHLALNAIQALYPNLSQRLIAQMLQGMGYKKTRRSEGVYYATRISA